jgi:hypothetical protein
MKKSTKFRLFYVWIAANTDLFPPGSACIVELPGFVLLIDDGKPAKSNSLLFLLQIIVLLWLLELEKFQ